MNPNLIHDIYINSFNRKVKLQQTILEPEVTENGIKDSALIDSIGMNQHSF